MPDFERVLDSLEVQVANTDTERARAEGFVAGKNFARFQVIVVTMVAAIVFILLRATT